MLVVKAASFFKSTIKLTNLKKYTNCMTTVQSVALLLVLDSVLLEAKIS